MERRNIPGEKAADLKNRFSYHSPKLDQPERFDFIRNLAFQFALDLTTACPESRELSLALTKLEEAVFWGNAAIARHETGG